MISDIRHGLRLLWKDKAFTVTAALTLALCIGANTALFSVVHNVLLRPLPVPESDRIVLMANAYPGAGADIGSSSGVPDYYDRLRDVHALEMQALYNGRNQSVDQNGAPTRIRVTMATPSFFPLLRVTPALGRTFTEDDGEPGNDKKVVLSYALWQSQFGGDPQAIGKDIRLDGQPFTVVGIMPKGLLLPEPQRDVVEGARVHRAGQGRFSAPRQQLSEHRTPQARREPRAGAAAGQRAQRREPRSVSAVQGTADQRALSHHGRTAAGQSGQGRESDALPDVGRRAVRAAHRLRERREPRARAFALPVEGARDAARARRGTLARGTAARDRERPAHDDVRGGRPAGRVRDPQAPRDSEHPGVAAR